MARALLYVLTLVHCSNANKRRNEIANTLKGWGKAGAVNATSKAALGRGLTATGTCLER